MIEFAIMAFELQLFMLTDRLVSSVCLNASLLPTTHLPFSHYFFPAVGLCLSVCLSFSPFVSQFVSLSVSLSVCLLVLVSQSVNKAVR